MWHSSTDELCDDCEGSRSGDEEGEHDPESMQSSTESPCWLTKLLKHCFAYTALVSMMNRTF